MNLWPTDLWNKYNSAFEFFQISFFCLWFLVCWWLVSQEVELPTISLVMILKIRRTVNSGSTLDSTLYCQYNMFWCLAPWPNVNSQLIRVAGWSFLLLQWDGSTTKTFCSCSLRCGVTATENKQPLFKCRPVRQFKSSVLGMQCKRLCMCERVLWSCGTHTAFLAFFFFFS